MKTKLTLATELALGVYLRLCMIWICFALGIQVFFLYLQFSGQEERSLEYANQFTWKFDGNFKNHPENIMYDGPEVK